MAIGFQVFLGFFELPKYLLHTRPFVLRSYFNHLALFLFQIVLDESVFIIAQLSEMLHNQVSGHHKLK